MDVVGLPKAKGLLGVKRHNFARGPWVTVPNITGVQVHWLLKVQLEFLKEENYPAGLVAKE